MVGNGGDSVVEWGVVLLKRGGGEERMSSFCKCGDGEQFFYDGDVIMGEIRGGGEMMLL